MSEANRHSRIIAASPVPYAWVVLASAMVTMVMTIPGQTVGISVVLDPIIGDLALSRSFVSGLYTAGTLIGSLTLPFVGRFVDRRGPRQAVVWIASAFALACLFMSSVSGWLTLAVGFVLVRALGQGSLSLVSQHVVALWFVRRRGFAIGLLGLAMATATAFVPGLLEALESARGWRGTYVVLAVLVAALAVPLGVAFFRDRPEAYGHLPDGARRRSGEEAPVAPAESNLSLAEARRTGAFWIVAAGDVLIAALSTGLIFHHFDILASGGIERAAAAWVFVPIGLVSAGSTLAAGMLLDRVRPRFILATMLVFQAIALILAGIVGEGTMLVYGATLGIASGIRGAVSGSTYAYYFGRRHLGAIKGFATTLTVAGTAIGPLLFAVGRDVTGGYLAVLWISALVPALLAAVSLRLRPPRASDA